MRAASSGGRATRGSRVWFDRVELAITLVTVGCLFAGFHAHDLASLVKRRELAASWFDPFPRASLVQEFAERLENQTYDARLMVRSRWTPATATDQLVLLTVDDSTIQRHGRWPWPRTYWVRIFKALEEIRAGAIYLDIVFPDVSDDTIRPDQGGSTPRSLVDGLVSVLDASLDPGRMVEEFAGLVEMETREGRRDEAAKALRGLHAFVTTSLRQFGTRMESMIGSPDGEFAQAISRARIVGMPTSAITVFDEPSRQEMRNLIHRQAIHESLVPDSGAPIRDRLARPVGGSPTGEGGSIGRQGAAGAGAGGLAGWISSRPGAAELAIREEDLASDLRMAGILAGHFDLTDEELAVSLSIPMETVLRRGPWVREVLLGWALGRELDRAPEGTLDRKSVRKALEELGTEHVESWEGVVLRLLPSIEAARIFREKFAWDVPGIENLELVDSPTITTSIPSFLRAMTASGSGNAYYDADGTLRRIPLFWRHSGKVFPHLSLAVALRHLGGKPETHLEVTSSHQLVIRPGAAGGRPTGSGQAGEIRLQLDSHGRLIIPWTGGWDRLGFPIFNIGPLLEYGGMLQDRDRWLRANVRAVATLESAVRATRRRLDAGVERRTSNLVDLVGQGLAEELVAAVEGDTRAAIGDPGRLERAPSAWLELLERQLHRVKANSIRDVRLGRGLLRIARDVARILGSLAEAEKDAADAFLQRLESYQGRFEERGRAGAAGAGSGDEAELLEALREAPDLIREALGLTGKLESLIEPLPAGDSGADRRLVMARDRLLPKFREEMWVHGLLVGGIENLRGELARRLEGKVCLIGDVQTAGTDFAPIPLQEHYPKVGLHANVFNSVLAGRTIVPWSSFSGRVIPWLHPLVLDLLLWFLLPLTALLVLPAMGIVRGGIVMLVNSIVYVIFCTMMLVQAGIWVPLVGPVIGFFLASGLIIMRRYVREERMKGVYRKSFETMVDPKIVEAIIADQDILHKLGGANYEVTAFFSDIAGFTTMSELLAPDQLARMLTDYLTPMTGIIVHDFGGTRDKYIGDAIVAFWGAPLPVADHAIRACLAALRQQERIKVLKRQWIDDKVDWYLALREKKLDIDFRIGLNTGVVKVGSFGSKGAVNYTMIGDAVNLAARLEGANKPYNSQIMISDNTLIQAKDAIEVRELDVLQVKGKLTGVRVYEVLAEKGKLAPRKAEVVAIYNRGLKLYREKRWDEAERVFDQALALDPTDGPSRLYRGRVADKETLAALPADWDGVYIMKTK